MSPQHIETLIIGAGPSGLAVAACLTEKGQACAVVDARATPGATWTTHYERLHLHTAKRYSHLPHKPMPKAYPRYPSRQQVIDYLADYAAHFKLALHLETRVTRAAHKDGVWHVTTEKAAQPGPTWTARNLVIASGYNGVPHLPPFPGRDDFQGEVVHSAHYGNGKRFAGKRVLVIGSGNSGAEIAIDLVESGASPALCIRGPLHVVPKEIMGMPAQRTTILMSKLPPRLADKLTYPIIKRVIGDLRQWGIQRPALGPLEQIAKRGRIPLIDVGTVALIKQGQIKVVGAIERFTAQGVVLTSGEAAPFDAIVMATGYRPALDRYLEGVESVTDDRGYPTVFGREAIIPGLFFCGFRNPSTGALRESSIEARRIAKAIAAA
ncbi:MAG: indole-3-pyruvate monooxygenase [Myxococcota bacterium]|jgi:indole-3-pyruvate monooxygenase